jgi:hypothetical protein
MGDETMNFRIFGTALAAFGLLASSFSAQAADIPRPVYKGMHPVVAYYNWTGFYVGVNGGASIGQNRTTDTTVVPGLAFPVFRRRQREPRRRPSISTSTSAA